MGSGGLSVPVRSAKLPLCEAWVMPIEEARAAFRALSPLSSMLYARGPFLIRGATQIFFREQALAGRAHPYQRAATDCAGMEYLVKKLPAAASAARASASPDGDPAMERIFDALRHAARNGRPCPSDASLARLAGLATKAQAQGRVAKLRVLGLIRSEAVTGDPSITRVVTIVKSGRHTLAPAGWVPSGGEK